MKTSELHKLIINTILGSYEVALASKVEIRCNKKYLGYITGVKNTQKELIFYDTNDCRDEYNVLDLLSALSPARNKYKRDREVVFEKSFIKHEVYSVYSRITREDGEIKSTKFYLNVT